MRDTHRRMRGDAASRPARRSRGATFSSRCAERSATSSRRTSLRGPLCASACARSRSQDCCLRRADWTPRPLTREWDAYFPKAVLLVDRPAMLDSFIGSGAMPGARLAVVCIDGSPGPVVAWLRRGFRAGPPRTGPVLARRGHRRLSLRASSRSRPSSATAAAGRSCTATFGLPPLGAPARRFGRSLDAPTTRSSSISRPLPPAALVSYVDPPRAARGPRRSQHAAARARSRGRGKGASRP